MAKFHSYELSRCCDATRLRTDSFLGTLVPLEDRTVVVADEGFLREPWVHLGLLRSKFSETPCPISYDDDPVDETSPCTTVSDVVSKLWSATVGDDPHSKSFQFYLQYTQDLRM